MGTILFIRDIKNLQPEHLHRFLKGLHKVKESENTKMKVENEKAMALTFPVIIETSGNLWMREAFCDTSNSPILCSYFISYLPSMEYIEGKQYMVKRYSLFDAETYNNFIHYLVVT